MINDAAWFDYLEKVHEEVQKWGAAEVKAMVDRITLAIKEIRASGIFGPEFRFPSLWEEYCWHVQEGPTDIPDVEGLPSLEDAWEMTIDHQLDFVLANLSPYTEILLSTFAAWQLEEHQNIEPGFIWPDGLKMIVLKELSQAAAHASISEYYP